MCHITASKPHTLLQKEPNSSRSSLCSVHCMAVVSGITRQHDKRLSKELVTSVGRFCLCWLMACTNSMRFLVPANSLMTELICTVQAQWEGGQVGCSMPCDVCTNTTLFTCTGFHNVLSHAPCMCPTHLQTCPCSPCLKPACISVEGHPPLCSSMRSPSSLPEPASQEVCAGCTAG